MLGTSRVRHGVRALVKGTQLTHSSVCVKSLSSHTYVCLHGFVDPWVKATRAFVRYACYRREVI